MDGPTARGRPRDLGAAEGRGEPRRGRSMAAAGGGSRVLHRVPGGRPAGLRPLLPVRCAPGRRAGDAGGTRSSPISYAVKGGGHAARLRSYKTDTPGAAAAGASLRALMLVFLHDHAPCIWRYAAMPPPTRLAVVPSGQGRSRPHPLLGLLSPPLALRPVTLAVRPGEHLGRELNPRRFRAESPLPRGERPARRRHLGIRRQRAVRHGRLARGGRGPRGRGGPRPSCRSGRPALTASLLRVPGHLVRPGRLRRAYGDCIGWPAMRGGWPPGRPQSIGW